MIYVTPLFEIRLSLFGTPILLALMTSESMIDLHNTAFVLDAHRFLPDKRAYVLTKNQWRIAIENDAVLISECDVPCCENVNLRDGFLDD